MKSARDRFEKQKAIAAQGDQKTMDLGNHLQDLHAQREVLERDLNRQETEVDVLRGRKSSVEDEMRKRERSASLLEKRDRLEAEVKELGARLQSQTAAISADMQSAWSSILIEEMQRALVRLGGESLNCWSNRSARIPGALARPQA